MRTARLFFYLLLAANIVLAVVLLLSHLLPVIGIQPPWAPSGEAERLAHQLTPEKIQLLAIAPPPAASPVAVQANITPPSASAPPAASSATPSTAPETLACVALRNLSPEDTQQLADRASRQGDGLAVRITGVTPASYWVIIPPNGGKEGATKRAEMLTKAGFTDRFIVRDAGPNQYAVSLGRFRNEDAANRLLETLQKKNFKSARITTVRDDAGNNARAEITGRTSLLNPLLKDFLADHGDAQRDACSSN